MPGLDMESMMKGMPSNAGAETNDDDEDTNANRKQPGSSKGKSGRSGGGFSLPFPSVRF